MASGMSDETQNALSIGQLEDALREALDRGNVVISTTRPILRHLLANGDQALFSDEVIARINGMLGHVAQQMLFAQGKAQGIEDLSAYAAKREAPLVQMMLEDVAFLGFAHALTIEAQIAQRLQSRSGIDSVLSPLLQELAASSDANMAAAAMRVLAAQARFMQHQRRMELPLGELPGDLFHKAMILLQVQDGANAASELAEEQLRNSYDESASRLGQIHQLVVAMDRKAPRALIVDHAGVAIFATALAMASGQDRALAILSFGEKQMARLALALRAAGLKPNAVEEQFLFLHPEFTLPAGFDRMTAERASSLLAASRPKGLA